MDIYFTNYNYNVKQERPQGEGQWVQWHPLRIFRRTKKEHSINFVRTDDAGGKPEWQHPVNCACAIF